MGNNTNRQASIDSRRIALEREVSIRVPRFDTFVTEYSQNISTTGMFIVSENPQPPGTSFSFEFSVADDWKLIRGKAQVVWTRYQNQGPERPAGMGVRFLEVDAQSRRLIRWIVEKHIREGGKPFELDELRTVIDQALEQVLDPEDTLQPELKSTPSPPPRTTARSTASVRNAAATTVRRSSERRVLPLVLTAAAVVIIVGLLFWLTEWLPGTRRESVSAQSDSGLAATDTGTPSESGGTTARAAVQGRDAAASPAATEQVTEAESTASATRPLSPAPPPIGSAYKSVLESLTAWADAWSAQDVRRYFSAYASDYEPSGGLSLRQWQAQRRERLQAPQFIKVSISGLEFDRVDDSQVRVRFTQSYRSDRFSDMVKKTMDLVWENGAWRIKREASA